MVQYAPVMGVQSVSLFGIGKLGAVIAGCIADRGIPVLAVDVSQRVVDLINQGKSPVFEPGVDELIWKNRARLSATLNVEEAVLQTAISFVIVPTPSDEEGGFSLRYVIESCRSIGEALRKKSNFHLVVITSTVMPGSTGGRLTNTLEESSGKRCGVDFGICYSPEFVALGTVIRDFMNPDFLLIGESDQRSGELLSAFYREVCNGTPPIARLSFVNAELAKLSVNTFVTTKITFANMLARICERLPGADVDSVTSAIGLDSRIGGKYLKGAIGYGGPCFPRDNLALGALAHRLGITANLAEATDHANRAEVNKLATLVRSKCAGNESVGILGLAYKSGTNVVEESQGLLLAQALAAREVQVVLYDPAGMENAAAVLPQTVKFAKSMNECVADTSVIVITTPWKEFAGLSPEVLTQGNRRRTVIDCWRMLGKSSIEQVADYIRLGTGPEQSGRLES